MTSARVWSADDLEALASAGVDVVRSDEARREVERDFGGFSRGNVHAVARPRDGEQIARVIGIANERGRSVSVRGLGTSQGGQSIAVEGVTIDMRALSFVEHVDGDAARCGGGTTWRTLLEATSRVGAMPRVMPLNLDLTIGGTLATAGFGSTSHRYGPAIANVLDLDVITGAGRRQRCSPHHQRDVFDATLAGLGRCSILERATIALRPLRAGIRTFALRYDDARRWLDDQRALLSPMVGGGTSGARVDHLEASCIAQALGTQSSPHGRRPIVRWSHSLLVSFEHDGTPPTADDALSALHPTELAAIDDTDPMEHATRIDGRLAFMRRSGAFGALHPWVEGLVPAASFPAFLARALDLLPPWLADGTRVFFVADAPAPPFFVRPTADAIGFAALPTQVPPSLADDAARAMTALHRCIVEAGGNRCLAGWLDPFSDVGLAAHFGDRWGAFREAKRRLDPRAVLSSALDAFERVEQ